MKEILKKASDLYEDLVMREKVINVRELECKKEEQYVIDIKHKLDARKKDLSAKERIVEKYENFEKIREDFNTKKNELAKKEKDINDLSLDIESRLSIIEKKEKDIVCKVEAYRLKSQRVSKIEADLKVEKENLKEAVLKEMMSKING